MCKHKAFDHATIQAECQLVAVDYSVVIIKFMGAARCYLTIGMCVWSKLMCV